MLRPTLRANLPSRWQGAYDEQFVAYRDRGDTYTEELTV